MNILNLQEKNKILVKLLRSLYIFLKTPDEEIYAKIMLSSSSDNYIHRYNVDFLKLFDPELQLINTKPMVKSNLKELLSDLKKFKVQIILVLELEEV